MTGLVGLVEAVEDVRQVRGRYPVPFVFDPNRDALDIKPRAEPQRGPRRRVADGVGGQVLQRLLQPVPIAAHDVRAGTDIFLDGGSLGLARKLVPRGHPRKQLRDRQVLNLQRCRAALESRQFEQVADQPFEAGRFVPDDRQVSHVLVHGEIRHRERFQARASR